MSKVVAAVAIIITITTIVIIIIVLICDYLRTVLTTESLKNTMTEGTA